MIKSALRAAILLFVSLPLSAQTALQPGESVPLPAAAMLQARPVADSELLAPVAAGTQVGLVSHSYNSSGSWWYVRVDGKGGWLPESALLAPPPLAPIAPVAPVAPPATVAPVMSATSDAANASPHSARRSALTAKGSRELELDLDISRISFADSSTNTAGARAKWGYCASDRNEFGGLVSIVKSTQDSFSFTSLALGPFYTLNLPSPPSTVVPYLGLSVMYRSDKYDDSGFSATIKGPAYGAWLGFRVFAGENISVNLSGYYEKASLKYEGSSIDESTAGLRVGLSGFLR